MLWFRERAAEATSGRGVVVPLGAGAVELPVFGPAANGLDASRRRREALRRSRSTRRTRTAALVLGPAVVLSVAAPKLAGGRAGTPLAEDPPSLTLRLRSAAGPGVGEASPPPGVRGTAGVPTSPRGPAGAREQQAAIDWHRATAHGLPYAGSLSDGTQLPVEGPDWVTWNPVDDRRPNLPGRLFGTESTIRRIVEVITAYRSAHPDAPRVLVGDISLRHGGPIDEHRSHQNGLDVDVYYPRRDAALRAPVTTDQVDRELAQDLLDRFVASGAEMVFVGYGVGLSGRPGVVVPYPNHENHMHVRFPD
jgi:hypothetical protein